MSTINQLVLIHLILAAFIAFGWASFWTRLPFVLYQMRMSPIWKRFLMPFGMSDEKRYVKYHQRTVIYLCALMLIVYGSVLYKIVKSS